MDFPNNKKANTDHDVHELISDRWSPRAFSDKSVDDETLMQLFEAARWAPSSYNAQPWRYIYAKKENTEAFERLRSCLVPFNQEWTASAAVLVLGCVKSYAQDDLNKPNTYAKHDLGAASMSMAAQATALGLYVHQMGGVDFEKARETYNLPEGFDVVTAIAIGYLGNPDDLSPEMRETEVKMRERAPISDFVFENSWGASE
jgi:nitroreductase